MGLRNITSPWFQLHSPCSSHLMAQKFFLFFLLLSTYHHWRFDTHDYDQDQYQCRRFLKCTYWRKRQCFAPDWLRVQMGIVGAKSTQLVLDRGWGGGIGYNINSITVVCYLPCACILILSHFFFPLDYSISEDKDATWSWNSIVRVVAVKWNRKVSTVDLYSLIYNELQLLDRLQCHSNICKLV